MFDTFIINMDRDVEKLHLVENEINKIPDLKYERFSGVCLNGCKTQSDGNEGCTSSHKEILKIARERKLPYVFILEDDVEFSNDIATRLASLKQFLDTNTRWEMLYLGGNHGKPSIGKITENILITPFTYSTHAYFIHSRIYDLAIESWEKAPYGRPVDMTLHEKIQCRNNCFKHKPRLAFQRKGFSNIQQRDVNYDFLKDEENNK